MPLITEDNLLYDTIRSYVPQEPEPPVEANAPMQQEPTTGFLEAGRAMYALEDPVFNIVKNFIGPKTSDVFDPNFKPIDKLQSERPDLVPYAKSFIDVRNEEEFNKKVFQTEYELEQKEVLSKASTMTQITAGLAAGVVDPITLIPFAKITKEVNTATRIAKSAATGLGLGAASGLTREAILQGTTETRSEKQSLTNLLVTSVAGSIYGAGIAAFAKPAAYEAGNVLLSKAIEGEDIKFVVDTFDKDVVGHTEYLRAVEEAAKKVPETDLVLPKAVVSLPGNAVIRMALDENAASLAEEIGKEAAEKQLGRSIGAAEVDMQVAKDALGLAHMNEKLAKIVSGPEGLRPPDLRAILSPSTSVRKLGEVFYDSNFIRKKHAEGIASRFKAENQIFRDTQDAMRTLDQVDKLYTRYTGKGDLLSSFELTRGADKINYREFSRRVYTKLVTPDLDDTIPEVNQAAALMRQEMDKTAAKLQKAGLLPEDLEPNLARSYMTRIYDLEKLTDPRVQQRFVDKVGAWIAKFNKDGSPRTTILDEETASLRAEEILDKIRGETDQAIALSSIAENFVSKGKFLKERQLLIPDAEIQEFLMDDAIQGFRNYQNKTSKLLAAQAALKEAGFDSIQDVQRAIRSEADDAISRLTDPIEINKLAKRYEKEEKLAQMMYRSVLGQLKKPHWSDKWVRGTLAYQYTRLLGNVTITSLSEIFMVPFRKGLLNTIQDGYLPFLRDFNVAKFSRNQLNDLTGALEMQQSGMLRSLSGLEDESLILRDISSFDLITQAASKGFSQASLIGYWTSFGSRMAAQVSAADLIRTFKRGVQDADVERLAALGIDRGMYSRLSDQINKYTKQYKGTYLVNPAVWKDEEALNVFKNAVQTDANSSILKPGIGTQPFFVQQSNLGKMIWQFKSFMSAATSKILISGIQRRDANLMTGIFGLIASGGLITMTKDKLAGREIKYGPDMFIANGLSNSGLLGLMGTTLLDTSRSFADPQKRRYLGQTVEGTLMGPTAGQIKQASDVIVRLSDGKVTDKDIKATLKMVPFNNLFYLNYLTNQIFDEE
jgi:hypothetical protein